MNAPVIPIQEGIKLETPDDETLPMPKIQMTPAELSIALDPLNSSYRRQKLANAILWERALEHEDLGRLLKRVKEKEELAEELVAVEDPYKKLEGLQAEIISDEADIKNIQEYMVNLHEAYEWMIMSIPTNG